MSFVMVINASPRKKQNCVKIRESITSLFNNEGIKYKTYDIYDMNIEYCTACGYCDKIGKCKYNDDMVEMYDDFNKCDGVIVISPVHFDSISAKMKTIVDRTQAFYASKYVLNKSSIDRSKKRFGKFISIGGSKPYKTQFEGGQIIMDFFFKSVNNKQQKPIYITNTDEHTLNVVDIDVVLSSMGDYIKDINSL